MDTTSLVALALLIVSAVLLVLISAAEASISAITRARVHVAHTNGLSSLLDSYITQRQRLLRALNTGGTTTTIITTLALTVLLLEGREFETWSIALAGAVALLVVGFLRQTARIFALANPEATGVRLARPIALLQLVWGPVAWLAALPARSLLRALGRDPEGRDTNPADELLGVLERPGPHDSEGPLSEERRMMRGILQMSEQTVRELMTPRTDLVAVSTDASLGDVMKLIRETGFSRIPLYAESTDHIVGMVYAKDLLAYLQTGDVAPGLRDIARSPYFVPETKRADDLLADLRRDQVHMAIAVDEYGGTAGVVTVEDLLEEIVGEIADEYDSEELGVQRLNDDEAIVDARLPIDDFNDLFGIEIDSEDFDTVGGLIFSLLGRLAVPGDEVVSEEHGVRLRVLSILGRRIKRVRVTRYVPAEESAAAV